MCNKRQKATSLIPGRKSLENTSDGPLKIGSCFQNIGMTKNMKKKQQLEHARFY
jgi:hypothetical protein